MRIKSRYVLLACCVLALVLLPCMIYADSNNVTDFMSTWTGKNYQLATYTISNTDLTPFGYNYSNGTWFVFLQMSGSNSYLYTSGSSGSGSILAQRLDSNNQPVGGLGIIVYTATLNNNDLHIDSIYGSAIYFPSNNTYPVYVLDNVSIHNGSDIIIPSAGSLYYNDISSVSSFTDDDGMIFYTGGLSLIATAAPNFYNALLGADGLATWLSSDIEAMFMYDSTNDDWYIMNAPQNLAYFADDHNSVTMLYSGYIDSNNNFVADSRSGSFSQVDITTYTATSGCYKWDGTTWYWSPTYNNVQVGRNANGFYVNRGSSVTRLSEAPNAEREAVIRGLTMNNPFIAHNGDLIAQYLQTEDNRETVVDGDLYSLLNSIKNWEQIDAITQKYLLLTINDVASLSGQVIDYLGPNYQYPTITSYFDSLFAFNGFRYFAYDVNGDTVEYNTNNHPIASALTEFYLMTTTLDNTGRPASTYSYDGQNKINPLSSIWNDIKNLPQAIANALEPIFPTIPDNNDTIIDTVGDYYNPVSLNPSNMKTAHDGMTDAMEFYNYQAPEGVSFIGIFSNPDRWTLFTEETLNNCGLYIEEGE